MWKTFNLRFNAILENLRKHRDLIDQEANALNIAESKSWRDEQLSQIREWRIERNEQIERVEKERLVTQVRGAVAWLGASEDQEDLLSKLSRKCEINEAHWILKESTVTSWLDKTGDSNVLWLNGKPGAGASFLEALIASSAQERGTVPSTAVIPD